MALALYRTYRPGSLAEVIGQEHVTGPLARALGAGRTHHAYLFSGPRGCGKTSTARILARSLNCEQGPTAQPCGTCRSCVELAPNGPGSMDVVELDAATHRGIDDARELREKAIYAPAASRYKIYIIDEAHQLTTEAANALLKVVEEPPPHLRFIFATTEPDKIIPTIRSRTFHYGFRLVSARTLADHLGAVCASEEVPAEAPALAVVARAGAGSVRDSLSVLGQLLAGAGPAGLTYADAVSSLGLTDASLIDDFIEALSQGSAASMFAIVDSVISAGHDPRRFVIDVLDRLRDLIILRADHDALAKGLIDVPDDEGQRMVTQSQALGLAELSRAADLVSAGLGQIKGATAPRLQLELLCARLALPALGDDLTSLLTRLERLERSGAMPAAPGTRGATPPTVATAGELREPAGDELSQPAVAAPTPAAAPTAAPAAADTAGGSPRVAMSRPPAQGATASEPAPPARPAPPRRPDLRTDAAPSSHRVSPSEDSAAAAEPSHGDAHPQAPTPAPDPAGGAGVAADPQKPRPEVADRTSGQGSEPAAGPPTPAPPSTPGPLPPSSTPAGPPHRSGAGPAAAGDDSLTRIREAWPAILDRLAKSSRVAWTAFHAATAVSCSNGALAVAVSEPGNVRAIAQRGHDERLRQAIIDVLALDLSIDVLHDPEPAAPGQGPNPDSGSPAGTSGPQRSTRDSNSGSAQAAAPAPAARPADVVRDADRVGPGAETADDASPDDPDLDTDAAHGLALITRELGAKPIGEIDHS